MFSSPNVQYWWTDHFPTKLMRLTSKMELFTLRQMVVGGRKRLQTSRDDKEKDLRYTNTSVTQQSLRGDRYLGHVWQTTICVRGYT